MAAQSDRSEVFNNLSSNITQLLYGRTENDRSLIDKTLDELNSLNYKYPVVTHPAKAVLLLNQCCSLIPPEDSDLVQKCCQLITSLITRQSLIVEGRTLTMAVQWCLKALKADNSATDILLALDALLRVKTGHDLIGEVVKSQVLLQWSKNGTSPEKTLFSLQCLEACTFPPEDVRNADPAKFTSEFQTCFDIFLDHVVKYNPSSAKLVDLKTCLVCLRGLQNIIIQRPHLLQDNLGIILGIVKSYMLFGVGGIDFLSPQKVMPSALSIPEPSLNATVEKKGGKTRHRKHKPQASANKIKKCESWSEDHSPAPYSEDGYNSAGNWVKTSDSDFSDTETGSVDKVTGRVRQAALSLFLHTVKLAEKTTIFSYWSTFVPENPSSGRHNLPTCILKDPTTRGRMAALNVLLVLLNSSKLQLAQAEKGENLAFTPFSVIVGLTIRELHQCLSLALMENSVPVLTQVLKCFAALVQATPYHRLGPGLISKVIRNVKAFIHHRDPTVQVTALMVLGCALATEPLLSETGEAFCGQTSTSEVPWLLDKCLSNLGVKADLVPTAVKLESLRIISTMGRNYFETLLAPYLDLITVALDGALCNKYLDVRLHAGTAVDFLGQAMNRYITSGDEKAFTVDHFMPFWHTLLDNSLTLLLQSEQQPVLRATGCDCLGSIGAYAFEQLPRDRQILCVTLLFACSRDEENNVKGAAVRALAICVLYPSLREDLGFVVDTAETILRVLQDDNLTVKIKSSWALGNLSDALVLTKSGPDLAEELPDSLVLKLLKATIKASREGDKVKMNAVRALGNILQLVDESLIKDQQFKQSVEEAMEVLVKNCTSGSNMKARWNSCYAVGNAMKNASLFKSTINWQEKVFTALTDLVVSFRNFKVRINAAVALSSPGKREYYKHHYHLVWCSLIKGLETAQNMEDFSEYKHRDHLVEQICLTLGHLMTLVTKEDLPSLKTSVCTDNLQAQMQRVWERLLPEKSAILVEARIYLTDLVQNEDLSTEQKSILQTLYDVLGHDLG